MKKLWWILLTIGFASGAGAHSGTVAEPPVQVDEQLEGFDGEDWGLYKKAMNLVQGSSMAIGQDRFTVAVFVTTKSSEWTQSALRASGYVLPAGAPAATARISTASGRPVDTVVLFWERILASEDPLPVLTISLARELFGSVFILNTSHDDSETGLIAGNLYVYKTVINFVRELQQQSSYGTLSPGERAAFDEYLDSLKFELREWRILGRRAGICEALLLSEDN